MTEARIENGHSTEPRGGRIGDGAGLIAEITAADVGLIYGMQIPAAGALREIELADVDAALSGGAGVVWLHFNLSNARARALLTRAHFVPSGLQEIFRDNEVRRRVELIDRGVLAIISDLIFEVESEPAEVAPLWCFVSEHLFITARMHPLKTTDQLRAALRSGLRVQHAIELLAWILGQRTESLAQLTQDMSEQVSEIEDEILGGAIKEQRVQLGRIRRFCARTRRHFAPDRSAFLKLLQRHPALFSEPQAELIRAEIEALSFLTDEAAELYERAKLLQEELASRLAEDTGRNLYVLAILSAVFLPMTLITGIFGMNVSGLPGLHSPAAFWLVMLLIVGVGVATLVSIFSRNRS
jgi:zinc transporter